MRLPLLAVAVSLVAVACAAPAEPTTTGPEPPPPVTDPPALAAFGRAEVLVDGTVLAVAVADTRELRARGLMGVTDLGDLRGMLFVFPATTGGGFWMKDTLIPLDIAFFDAEGQYVAGFAMEPCRSDPCPVYTPSGRYRYALETPAGSLPGIGPGSRLVPPG